MRNSKLGSADISAWGTSATGAISTIAERTYPLMIDSYTPRIICSTLTAIDTTFSTNNPVFVYVRSGALVVLNARFNITNAGSTGGVIYISLPPLLSGYAYLNTSVGMAGSVSKSGYAIRRNEDVPNAFAITTPGGGDSAPSIGTGYVEVMCIAFVYKL